MPNNAPMQITHMRCGNLRRDYSGALRNTRHAWTAKNYVLVELVTQTGLRGYGEMYCDGGGTPEVALAILRHEIAPHVIGRDALRPVATTSELRARMALSARGTAATAAISAVDIAMWDLLGKASGMPLYRLLGGHSNSVPVYASGGMYGNAVTPESIAREMKEAQKAGVRGAKIKIGGASIEEDVERLQRTREAIGPGAPLMGDAMFAPDVAGAIELGRRAAPLLLHFLEAPTAMDDVEGWCAVTRATGLALAGPELSDDSSLMRRMVESGAVRYLQFDLAIAGGISMGHTLAGFAGVHRRSVSLHCAASAIAMAAAAHLGAAIANCDSLEFHVMHDGLRERLWSSGWLLAEGRLVAPERAGLGVELADEDLALLSDA